MIRQATPADVPRMLELAQLMHEESPRFRVLHYDIERMRATIESVIGHENGFARVVELDGAVQGGLLAVLAPNWGSPDLTACDVALFVNPDARGGMAAARLLKAYAHWATERGARHVLLGLMTGVQVDATAHLCERLGWRQAGVVMEYPACA